MLIAKVEFQGKLVKASVRQYGERVGPTAIERVAERAEGHAYALNADALGMPADRVRQYNIDKLMLASSGAEVHARRGRITRFSRKSRKRLIDLTARLRSDAGGVLVTLTYRKNMRDYSIAKSHLNKFLKYISSRFPNAPVLWRMERQARGAVHFHVLVFGKVWFDTKDATRVWQEITLDDSYPDFQYLDGQRAILSYVSKYVAKLDVSRLLLVAIAIRLSRVGNVESRLMIQRLIAVWVFGLDIGPYFPSATQSTGRHWGYRNKERLPFADKKVMFWYYTPSATLANAVYYRYKRYVRRKLSGKSIVQQSGFSGFTLYADADQWYKLWCYNIYV